LKEEFKRLKSWATLTLNSVDERLVEVERNQEHGKSILLGALEGATSRNPYSCKLTHE
jgi:hypothetical protein